MPQVPEDPVLISSRREALIVLATWFVAMVWSVSYCYTYGYVTEPKSVEVAESKQAPATKSVEVRKSTDPNANPELWVDRGRGPEQVKFVLGFPDWIFWGVALPWWLCTAFSLFFGAFLVRDEDLGADIEAEDEPHAAPEQKEVQHA